MLKFLDEIRDVLADFGISEWDARTAFTQADEVSHIPYQGDTLTITWKQHDARPLIAVAQRPRGGPGILLLGVFPVPPTVTREETPLKSLEALCELYGLEIPLEGRIFKLIVSRHVDLPVEEALEPFQKAFTALPRARNYTGVTAFRNAPGVSTDVGLLFLLDATALVRDLNENHLSQDFPPRAR